MTIYFKPAILFTCDPSGLELWNLIKLRSFRLEVRCLTKVPKETTQD